MDLNDYVGEDSFDFDRLKKDVCALVKKQGLRDIYVRRHYQDMMTKEQKDALIIKAIKTKSNKKFLTYLNTGLVINDEAFADSEDTKPEDYVPSLLNQAIESEDFPRIMMLLSAGAPVKISPECPMTDSIYFALNTANPSIMAVVLSFVDEKIGKHWIYGALQEFYARGVDSAVLLGQIYALKLEQQGVDIVKYMEESENYYKEILSRKAKTIRESSLEK